ncbi:hypothetical protein FRC08_004420 [Ceratobasidium sp. 394]|nr:hypothetical protein FRC08_004420 [Ceratobasidium sp. 394]
MMALPPAEGLGAERGHQEGSKTCRAVLELSRAWRQELIGAQTRGVPRTFTIDPRWTWLTPLVLISCPRLPSTRLSSLPPQKDAGVQAAFCSHRVNYIVNFEETVTHLKYVVCDIAEVTKQENMELRSTINSMCQAECERERVWCAQPPHQPPAVALRYIIRHQRPTVSASVLSCQQTLGSMVMCDGTHSMIEYQPRLGYPQPGKLPVHQLPSPADTMNVMAGYNAYSNNQNMIR